MSDVTNRREILKIVATLPFAIAAAPFKVLIPVERAPKHRDLVAKFSEEKLSSPGSCVSFELQPHHLPSALQGRIGGVASGYATRLPSGEVVAYSAVGSDENCSYEYVSDANNAKADFNVESVGPYLACKCHGKVFDIHKQALVAGAGDKPAKLGVKRCHNKVCIISALGDVTA